MLKRPVPGKKQRWAMALLSAALACATGYAAWAAQPARVVAAAKQVYEIKVSATLDGVPQTFQLRQPAGLSFSFSMTSPNGVSWDGEFTLQPEGERLRLSGTLKADRVVVATPMLVFTAGKTAGIGVSGPANGSPWSLSFLVLEVPVTAPVATKASAPANVVVSSKNQAPPSYPREAFEHGISGKVVLEVDVAADGSVSDVVVVESTPRGVFDESTLSAARKWRFNPAQEEGKAVAGKVRVPVWFDMDEDAVHDQASGG